MRRLIDRKGVVEAIALEARWEKWWFYQPE